MVKSSCHIQSIKHKICRCSSLQHVPTVLTFWLRVFTKTFVQHVVLCGPEARGAIIRAQTCCLYVLLTCSRVFSGVSRSRIRKTNRRLVPSSSGGERTRQHNKQVQSTTLFERHAWVTSPGQIWCVCCHKYCITEIYGRGATAWALGKLQHYVPWDNEILLSSLFYAGRSFFFFFPQMTRLIKASLFGSGWILEFLSAFSSPQRRMFAQHENVLFQI